MAVLTNIPNNTSARDWRDTMNSLIKRIAALEAAGVPVETPAPAFTTQPSISPTSGTAGSTVYAATPGTVSNGSVVSRAWLLNGTAISTGVTAVPASSGTLTYQETASGPGGTTTSTVQVAAVTAATVTPTPAPSFTSQPSISPNTGTAGTTTFTATAGNVSNGSITARSWTINGTVISTGITAAPASSGTLTYQETATGSGGTTQSTVQQVTVATAAAAAPAFTSQPTISPSTGTAGATTYTATPGAVSNGTITSRAWALNGSTISTGLTAAPTSAGTLTYQEFATGTGGSASSSVLTRTVSAATPALALSPTVPSISSSAAAGTLVSNISNVPAGVTPSVTPNDGRLVIAGDASAGWKVVVGMSALSAGQVNFTVAASGATSANGVLTISAPNSVPDGTEESLISPTPAAPRSTYSMTRGGQIDTSTIPLPGAYYVSVLDLRGKGFPWDWMLATSTDHAAGANADGGIWGKVVMPGGDPTVAANWVPHPNPGGLLWGLAGQGKQIETPHLVLTEDNRIVCFYQHNGPTGALNQATLRLVSSDGYNFVSGTALVFGPASNDLGDHHSGYPRPGRNPFPGLINSATGQPWKYVAYPLQGGQLTSTAAQWVSDDIAQDAPWTKLTALNKLRGRVTKDILFNGSNPGVVFLSPVTYDLSSARTTPQGVAMMGEIVTGGSGATSRKGQMYEVLFDQFGREASALPIPVLLRTGVVGEIDGGEINTSCTEIYGNKRFMIASVSTTDGGTNGLIIYTGPLRNPGNSAFLPLSPPNPTTVYNEVTDFTALSAVPATWSVVTAGTSAPVPTFDSNGINIPIDPTQATPQSFYLFYNQPIRLDQIEMVEIYLDTWMSRTGAFRKPHIGLATSKTVVAAMTDAIWLSNGYPTSSKEGKMFRRGLNGGVETSSVKETDTYYGFGHGAGSGSPAFQKKNPGLRVFGTLGEAYFIGEGRIEAEVLGAGPLIDRTKEYYFFVGFDGVAPSGAVAGFEMIKRILLRMTVPFNTGTGGGTPLAMTGSPAAASVGSSDTFTPAISGGTGPYTLSLASGTLPPGRTVNGSAKTVTGTYTTAGSYSYVLRVTDNVGATANLTVNMTVAASGGTGTPATYQTRAIATSASNANSYSHTGLAIGSAAATRRIALFVGGRAGATSPTLAVTITPAGGSAITMTQVGGGARSTFDSPAETSMLLFVADVPTGTTADVNVTVTNGPWVREGLTLFPVYDTGALMPTQVVVASGPNSAALSVTVNKLAKGVVLGAAVASGSSSTSITSAAESGTDNPSAVSGATVSLSNIAGDPAVWTGLANSVAPTQMEANGSAGGAMIVATWAAA